MFSNIGGKIKNLAMVLCGIGISGSVLLGILLISNRAAVPGIIFMIVGSLFSWVGSFVLYGFGQLVENSDRMASNAAKSFALQQFVKEDLSLIIESLSSKKDDT